jgi:two-component system, NarL family, nitrate/nitrite response regulator NarL
MHPNAPLLEPGSGTLFERRIAIVGEPRIGRGRDGLDAVLAANRHVEAIDSTHSLEELEAVGIRVGAVILDLYLDDVWRITAAISAIASLYPVLIICASTRRDDMLAAVRAGASGYVTRNASSAAIIEAVDTIVRGGLWLSLHLTDTINADPSPIQPTTAQARLSRREREALLYISQGLTQAQTANRMGVSPATADTYVKRIRRKFGPGNKADLTRQAASLGYLDPRINSRAGRRPVPGR